MAGVRHSIALRRLSPKPCQTEQGKEAVGWIFGWQGEVEEGENERNYFDGKKHNPLRPLY